MPATTSILVYINGTRRIISGDAALETLLNHLRLKERLTGAKLGCGEGGCGACTVLLSSFNRHTGRISHRAVNACLMPLAACDGMAVTTVEAVGDRRGGLAPVQRVLADAHGSQCGFCTPGIVMSMFALLREHAASRSDTPLTRRHVEENFDGNLCRCTGYRPILDAFSGLVERRADAETCSKGEGCCRTKDSGLNDTRNCTAGEGESTAIADRGNEYGPTIDREYIFPPELIRYVPQDLNVANGRWLRPTSMKAFIQAKRQFPKAKIVIGNTELGIETKFKGLHVPVFLCATHIPELSNIYETEHGVDIGACVTWAHLSTFVQDAIAERERDESAASKLYQTSSIRAIQSQLRWFAGKQIRNVAAVGGNIVTASPISDVNPIWMAVDATFTLLDCSTGQERSVQASEFFISYRKVDMKESEILLKIFIPWNESHLDVTHAFKVSRRHEDDIAIVSSGIRMRLECIPLDDTVSSAPQQLLRGWRIADVAIAFGGLAPKTMRAVNVERNLVGKRFDEETLQKGLDLMAATLQLPKDVPGGMPEFRLSLALGFLFKAFLYTAKQIDGYATSRSAGDIPSVLLQLGLSSKIEEVHMSVNDEVSHGVQIYPDGEPGSSAGQMGKSRIHLSADLQVSGEAKYLDDIPTFQGELQAALVLSSEAHAEILSIDDEEAMRMPGVHKVVKVQDVRGSNMIGPSVRDEMCFAEGKVTTVGQVIALVTAKTQQQAKKAAKAVRVKYKPLPAIVTIEEAIAAGSYAPDVPPHSIDNGNVDEVFNEFKRKKQIIEGRVRIGAQEHWYLEPQGAIAVPDENGEMLILSSTQSPSKTQESVAKVLGEPMHKVVCKVKRLGGGFGGKESRSLFIAAATAVASQASGQPVRLVLDRDTDMLISGTRHAFLADYRVACEPNGRIVALELDVFVNMGNNFDLTIPVVDRSLFHAQNCYDIPNVRFQGRACFTHSASATAFRGFGGPQGMLIAETIIERVSWATKLSPVRIRDMNMFGKNGNSCTTAYGMNFNVDPLLSCWDGVLKDATFVERRKAIDDFNRSHELRKRGIAAIPTMFGISFTFKAFNQAGALVHIFHGDGSVLISHGGVEMGQGLHTKICQVAATELDIPLGKVFISETATDKVPNASPTAASSSSDLYGMAVRNACATLKDNLKPVQDKLGPSASWEEVLRTAWLNRISLSATGFYRTPELDNLDLGQAGSRGRPFFYFTNGAAVSEVEIDVLTGESTVVRTDIVMDVGRALNPAIDVGQIEGAFVQGLGWCTMEEVVRGSVNSHAWVKAGQMLTLGPSTYKIPGFSDIPKDFRVRVLDSRNEKDTIHSSKAIGEPPLFLAASVFFAIRDAVGASRLQNGLDEWFELDSPATVERIRMACGDKLLRNVLCENGNYRPSLSL